MGEKQGIRERKERFVNRLVRNGTDQAKAEKIAKDTIRRLEYDGRLDDVKRKEQQQR